MPLERPPSMDDGAQSAECGRVRVGHVGQHEPMSPGALLSRRFFVEEVQPIVDRALGDIGYLAARLGSGSDVLGFDDELSTDHDFGCRLTLLVDDEAEHMVDVLDQHLEAALPEQFAGHPVRFATTWEPRVRHKIDIHTVHDFAASRLGFDLRTTPTPVQWLCLTGQSILEVAGGPAFHDTTVSYRRLVETLRWYPDDVWYYVVAAAWTRLSQELPFVGRTGQRRDDIGSAHRHRPPLTGPCAPGIPGRAHVVALSQVGEHGAAQSPDRH